MPTHDRQTPRRGRTHAVRPLAACLIAALVVGVLAAGAASAQTAADPLEPNDDRANATRVDNGSAAYDAAVDRSDDVDYYAVEATAGDTVVAELGFDSGTADLDLALENSTGGTVATSEYGTDGERVAHEIGANGTYYVRVDAYGGAPAAYALTVNTSGSVQPTEEAGFDSAAADNATRIAGGDTQTDTVANASDVHYYAVAADPGDRITATLSTPSSADLDLELRARSGEALAVSYGATGDEQLSQPVERGGTYYVVVRPHSGAPAAYDLGVETASAAVRGDALEPNDDHRNATAVSGVDSHSNLSIGAADDVDYFAVRADAGDTVTATISHPSAADLDLALEDVTGTALATSYYGTDSERIDYEVDASGTYYVRVQAFAGAPADYNITVGTGAELPTTGIENGTDLRAIEPGETASATVDRSDPTVDGHVHEPVTFSGQRGQNVTVTLEADATEPYVVLQDPTGEYVATAESEPDGDTPTIASHTLGTTGEYTVLVTSVNGEETFDYRLSLSEPADEAAVDATRETPNSLAADASQATETTDSGSSAPEFGVLAAIVALIATGLVARRRR